MENSGKQVFIIIQIIQISEIQSKTCFHIFLFLKNKFNNLRMILKFE